MATTKKFSYYFLNLHFHHFSKMASHNEVTNSRNQGFSYYFCLMIEGSGSEAGFGRPKNIRIGSATLLLVLKFETVFYSMNLISVFRLMPRIRIGSRDSACQTSRPIIFSCYFLSPLLCAKQNYNCNIITLEYVKINANITISEV